MQVAELGTDKTTLRATLLEWVEGLYRPSVLPSVILAGVAIDSKYLALEVCRTGYVSIWQLLPESAWPVFDGLSAAIAECWDDPAGTQRLVDAWKAAGREIIGAASRMRNTRGNVPTFDEVTNFGQGITSIGALRAAFVIRGAELAGDVTARARVRARIEEASQKPATT